MSGKNLIINKESCRIFSSGLYVAPYFTIIPHLWKEIRSGNAYEKIEYNRNLLAAYCGEDLDNTDEDRYNDDIDELFWEKLAIWTIYFKPLRYDEEEAFKCKLLPFKYSDEEEELELLALRGYGMDLSPKLEAYQALVSGTIDERSLIFSDPNYFKYVVGEEITQEVLKAVTKE